MLFWLPPALLRASWARAGLPGALVASRARVALASGRPGRGVAACSCLRLLQSLADATKLRFRKHAEEKEEGDEEDEVGEVPSDGSASPN